MSAKFRIIKQLIIQLENDIKKKENEKFDLKEVLLECARKWYFKDSRFKNFTDEQKDLHWRGTVADEKQEEYIQKCKNVKCPTNTQNIPTDFTFNIKTHRYICNNCGTEQDIVDVAHWTVKFTKGRLFGPLDKGTFIAGDNPNESGRKLRETQKAGEKLLRNIEKQNKKEDMGQNSKNSEFEKQKIFHERLQLYLREILEQNSSLFGTYIDEIVNSVIYIYLEFRLWYSNIYGINLTGNIRKAVFAVLLQYYCYHRNIASPKNLNNETLVTLFSVKQPVIDQARELIRQARTKLHLLNNIYPNDIPSKRKEDIFQPTMTGEDKKDLSQIYKLVKSKWGHFTDDEIKLITITYYYTKQNPKCGIKQFGGDRKCSSADISEYFKIDDKKILTIKELNNYIKIIHRLNLNS